MSAAASTAAPPLRSEGRWLTWVASLGAATVYAPIGLSYLFGLLLLVLFVALPGRGDRKDIGAPGDRTAHQDRARMAVAQHHRAGRRRAAWGQHCAGGGNAIKCHSRTAQSRVRQVQRHIVTSRQRSAARPPAGQRPRQVCWGRTPP